MRRVLLTLDYQAYSLCLAKFFEIEPLHGETIALDGKVLRGSHNLDTPGSTTESHRAIQLVIVYVVERGLILLIQPVDKKSNDLHCSTASPQGISPSWRGFCLRCTQHPKKLVSRSSSLEITT